MKAKTVVGIGLGLVHGRLNSSNIHFNEDHDIQITDLDLIDMEDGKTKIEGFSSAGWTPQTDVRGFASILFEIMAGRPVTRQSLIPSTVPEFVSNIIKMAGETRSTMQHSFCDIFGILEVNNFAIVEGVDRAEVLAFVK